MDDTSQRLRKAEHQQQKDPTHCYKEPRRMWFLLLTPLNSVYSVVCLQVRELFVFILLYFIWFYVHLVLYLNFLLL